ncbi:MAG: DNA recombination protein RmuC [SAR202 cluster bacterium]|nr:DNA recombination protein RmuC [SAR202 cluster bacterium]
MDVKFPLENYLKCMEAKTQQEQDQATSSFLRDVRGRLKEVVTRDYINPAQHTLDYVLLFIPNEQIYHFIHAKDGTLLDEAMKNHVVLCAPMTLFAILVVMRQAANNFALEQTSNQIISEMGAFKKQWDEFVKSMGAVGKRIEATQTEYELLVGRRRRALERPLNRIENIRKVSNIPLPDGFPELPDGDESEGLELDEAESVESND